MEKQRNWEQLLNEIQPQQAPHFLFTRIEERLKSRKKLYFSPTTSKVLAACLIGLLSINILLITKLPNKKNESQSIANAMGITSSENIYNQP